MYRNVVYSIYCYAQVLNLEEEKGSEHPAKRNIRKICFLNVATV